MYPLKKGKTTSQAHVGIPEGTFEEEHEHEQIQTLHTAHTHTP